MRQLTAFTTKEFLEQLRTGRCMLLLILFCLFGIMNPAIAKMTPWLLETMSEQLSESGMAITGVEVDAMTSWTQFFKNIPMALIVFLVMFSGILTSEYQKGTLINVLTKGMKRWKVLAAKLTVMSVFWTACYLITFGITYGYNACFWDNAIVQNLSFAAFGYYLAGLWLITAILPASAVCRSASPVILFAGAAFLISYLLSFFPALKEYMPTFLMRSNELLTGAIDSSQCMTAVAAAISLIIINIISCIALFNKTVI